jgi:hypothetical protein
MHGEHSKAKQFGRAKRVCAYWVASIRNVRSTGVIIVDPHMKITATNVLHDLEPMMSDAAFKASKTDERARR